MTVFQFTLRLAVALLLGVAIGFERQWRQKSAGLRTNSLVSMGSAAFILWLIEKGTAKERGWTWCRKCQGLFFSGNALNSGVCPADKQAHDGSQSGRYAAVLGEDAPGQQGRWRRCYKCQGMFFSGNRAQGVCPADSQSHDGSQSVNYAMVFDNMYMPTRQGSWRWCLKCQGFFFVGNPDKGTCPAGGVHDASASGWYAMPWE